MAALCERFFERLHHIYTPEVYEKVYSGLNVIKRPIVLRINQLKTTPLDVIKELNIHGITIEALVINDSYKVTQGTYQQLIQTSSYKEGWIYLQQIASQIPAWCMDLHEGLRVLDVTAAPGSKTSQMAALMNNTGEIVANELDIQRVRRLRHNMQHLGCSNVTIRQGNALDLPLHYEVESFDRILCDLPCSAEGRINLNIEKSYGYWNEGMFVKHYKHQRSILRKVIPLLKEGGILVYSTCTLAPEENEGVVHYILSNHPELDIEIISLPYTEWCNGITQFEQSIYRKKVSLSKRGLPSQEAEGFFVAKFRKKTV